MMKLNRCHLYTTNEARAGGGEITPKDEATLRPRYVLFARLRESCSVHPHHDYWYRSCAAPGELCGSPVAHHHGCGSEVRDFVETIDLRRCQDQTVCSSGWKHRAKNHYNTIYQIHDPI